MDMRKTVGENFARFRKARGLTQEEAAIKAGVAQSYIGLLERGRRNPTIISLLMLADAVGARPADLLQPFDSD